MIQRCGAQKYPDTVWGKGNPPKVGRKNLSAWACAEEAQDCFFRTPSGEKALFMLGERQGQPLEAAAAGGAGSRSLLLRDLFHCPNTVPAGAGTDLEESNMVFGLLKDIKNGEYRTIATPAEIATIVADGHTALVQRGAGEKAGFEDQEYEKAGARLVDTMEDIYGQADFVTKVKELEPCEFPLLRKGQIIFTCIHPAAHPQEVQAILDSGCIAFTAEDPDAAAELIAKAEIVAKAPIAKKALPYCNITFISGDEMKTALSGYLQALYDQNPASVGGELPDDGFYYIK